MVNIQEIKSSGKTLLLSFCGRSNNCRANVIEIIIKTNRGGGKNVAEMSEIIGYN